MSTTQSVPQKSDPPRQTLPRRKSSLRYVALHGSTLVAFLAASSVPTPLYGLYQEKWGFSATVLTVVFAAYALALLLSLLVTARLSDHTGRRPAISLALGLQIAAMATFLLADGVGWLVAARVVQGFATGVATAAVSAAVLDLVRARGTLINSMAPMVGMAIGSLGSTALMVYGPWPLHMVYTVLLGIFFVLLGLTWLTPETTERRPGALVSLKPRITVPSQTRKALLSVTPALMAVWMLGGFYLSLMPSLIETVTMVDTPWLSGIVVAALTLTGASAVLIAQKLSTFTTLMSGGLALGLGLTITLVGANLGVAALMLGGSVIAGFGFGASFLGAMRNVLPLAQPHQRAGLMGVFYIISYTAHSVPTIAAGYLVQHAGELVSVNIYGVVIVALVASSIAFLHTQALKRRDEEEND